MAKTEKTEKAETKKVASKKAAAPKKTAEKKSKKSNEAFLDIQNVRAKTADELQSDLIELKKEQFNLRFQKKNGELTNLARIRQVRRNIAKIQTVQTENRKKEATNA